MEKGLWVTVGGTTAIVCRTFIQVPSKIGFASVRFSNWRDVLSRQVTSESPRRKRRGATWPRRNLDRR